MKPSNCCRSLGLSVVATLFVACGGQSTSSGSQGTSSGGANTGGGASNDNSTSVTGSTSSSVTAGGASGSTMVGSSIAVTRGGYSSSVGAGGSTGIATGTTTSTTAGGSASRGGNTNTLPQSAGTSAGGTNGGSSTGTPSAIGSLPDEVPGVWLIGWEGGLAHWSWIRFAAYDANQGGRIDILDVDIGTARSSYFRCEGEGRWYLTATPDTVNVRLPPDCGQDAWCNLTFKSISAASGGGGFPKATKEAVVMVGSATSTATTVGAYKYPDSQCDAAMTTCQSPR